MFVVASVGTAATVALVVVVVVQGEAVFVVVVAFGVILVDVILVAANHVAA